MPRADLGRVLGRLVKSLTHSRFAQGTFALQVGGGAQRLFAFATHLILARGLGAEPYGEYVLVVSLTTALPFVLDVGVRRAVLTRFAAHHAEGAVDRKASVLAAACKLSATTALLAIALGAVVLPVLGSILFESRLLGVLAWVLLWGKLADIPFRLLQMACEASRRMGVVLRLELANEAGRLAAVAVAMGFGWSLTGLVAALLGLEIVLGLIGTVVIVLLWHRRDSVLPPRLDLARAWASAPWVSLLRFGLLASAGKRLDQGVRMILVILLGSLGSPTDAGLFRIAVAVGTLPAWLFSAVSRNLLPTLSGHAAEGQWLFFRRTLRRATLISAVAAALAAGLLALAAPWILQTMYGGGEFGAALPAVELMLLYTMVTGCMVGHEAVYLATHDLTFFNIRNLIGVAAVLALSPWVVAAHGAVGAAALTVGGAALVFLIDIARIWLRWSPPSSISGQDRASQAEASGLRCEDDRSGPPAV